MSQPKRNDPCPCGGGNKYKKWCGKDNVLAFTDFPNEKAHSGHSPPLGVGWK